MNGRLDEPSGGQRKSPCNLSRLLRRCFGVVSQTRSLERVIRRQKRVGPNVLPFLWFTRVLRAQGPGYSFLRTHILRVLFLKTRTTCVCLVGEI